MWLDRLRAMKRANQAINRSDWTTEKISEKSGVPIRTLDKIFAGTTKDPKLLTMQNLVYTLGYTLDDLFNEGPLPEPNGKSVEKFMLSGSGESEIMEAYRGASDDDKAVVNAALRKYIIKKEERIG